jgi:hypothetical protein
MNTQPIFSPTYLPALQLVARHKCNHCKAALYADGTAGVWGDCGAGRYIFIGVIPKISKREFENSSFVELLELTA